MGYSLGKAIEIAAKAHEGQSRWGGEPYIMHPLRVMMKFKNEDERIVAILHDVIEDTNITAKDLREIFPDYIVTAIEAVSHIKGESYEDFIRRASQNPLAARIKIEDIRDNSSLEDYGDVLEERDIKRIVKYAKALVFLMNNRVS